MATIVLYKDKLNGVGEFVSTSLSEGIPMVLNKEKIIFGSVRKRCCSRTALSLVLAWNGTK